MKINRDSWHFRYIASKWDNYPKALCWYFWKVVLNTIGWVIWGIGMSLMGILVLVVMATPVLGWWGVPMVVSLLSAVLWIALYIACQYHYRKYLHHVGKIIRPIKPYKEPSLAVQWLDAKHRKVCPLLQYSDETEL